MHFIIDLRYRPTLNVACDSYDKNLPSWTKLFPTKPCNFRHCIVSRLTEFFILFLFFFLIETFVVLEN